MKIKVSKKLQDYALFCAVRPSSDGYYGLCGLLLRGEFDVEEWQDIQVVYDDKVSYDDGLEVILTCDKDEVKRALKDFPRASCMSASAFIKKYRQQLIAKYATK